MIENKPDIVVDKIKTIQIHHHTDKYGALIPIQKHGNFYDLSTAQDTFLKAGESTLIPLGVSINLPDGYYATLLPRSSTFSKYGILIANSVGIIDSEYRSLDDEWKLSVYATRDIYIPKNERIAQFTIHEEIPFILEEAVWEAKARGGFGSSDQKK